MTLDLARDRGNKGPITPRPAATVIVVREGSSLSAPLEVLALRRNHDSEFVGGAYLFPGGGVDDGDRLLGATPTYRGATEFLSRQMGLSDGAAAFALAAVRECFEESGILFARKRGQKEKVATDVSPRFGYRRRALNEHHILFEELLAAENLVISWDEFYYFAHWITPPGAPRRYDTRFFLAVAPSAQSPTHDTHEMIECTWKSPRELLQAFEEKSIFMMRPTVRSIYALSQFASLHALLEALGPIAPGLVDMVDDGGGLRRRFIGESDEEAARGPHPAPRFSAKPMP